MVKDASKTTLMKMEEDTFKALSLVNINFKCIRMIKTVIAYNILLSENIILVIPYGIDNAPVVRNT